MQVIIVGAGIIGVCTAWWLKEFGHDVILIDRRANVALETTFKNGGQLAFSCSYPLANLFNLKKLFSDTLGSITFSKSKLNYFQLVWIIKFLCQCIPGRLKSNIYSMLELSKYSQDTLSIMVDKLKIEFQRNFGIIHFYEKNSEFKFAKQIISIMNEFDFKRQLLTTDEIITLEPALQYASKSIIGGDYTKVDQIGNAHIFTEKIFTQCKQAGVKHIFFSDVTKICLKNNKYVKCIEIIDKNGNYEKISADAFVLAAGCHSMNLIAPLNIRSYGTVYPGKGYSISIPIVKENSIPHYGLISNSKKTVFTRLGNTLRVAGCLEVFNNSRSTDEKQCQNLINNTRNLFGNEIGLDFDRISYWSGLRPLTSSSVPIIGQTEIRNLYLNTGHGMLGWTMGPGSGRALAEIISGKQPKINFPFL